MEEYIVSARKYRPATFSSVIGQQALTTTLKNAIASGKLANTYLFCGPRGVGKTTCARIFAKTINCEHRTPDGEACGECESCKSFNKELRSYNVFELDAASNNSVDDIRVLTEQVRIAPMNGKYKVYVIDEVHMLSTQAFNAFLKTLEEPPAYAIFILATTEKHKIIPTILSRCQIYDFNRMSNDDIIGHLKSVAASEGIAAEDQALEIIAEKSDGGMRDALSIFDQVVSFSGGNVTYEKTIENLNVIDYNHYFKFTEYFLEKKISESLILFNDLIGKGFDGSNLVSGLMLHTRNLLVSKDACTVSLLEMSEEMKKRYSAQAAACQQKQLYRTLKILNNCDLNLRNSKNKRLQVELALIQCCQADEDDEGSGRKPRKLKPIFSKIAAVPAQPVTAEANPADVSAAISTATAPATPVTAGPETAVPTETAQSPAAQETAATRKIPVMKAGSLFAPIFSQKKGGTAAGGNSAPTSQGSTIRRNLRNLNNDNLNDLWQGFASTLQREDTPLKSRMLNCTPTLIDAVTFSVTAGNSLASMELEENKDRILDYFRTSLGNPGIEMRILTDNTINVSHILTRDEQYQQMKEESPALKHLEELFSLEMR